MLGRIKNNSEEYKRKKEALKVIPSIAGVYLVTDTGTGKQYIGSSKNVNSRVMYYIAQGMHNKQSRSVDKNLLEFKFLEDCTGLTKQERLAQEEKWIEKFNTYHPNGYNILCPVPKYNKIQLPKLAKPRYTETSTTIKQPISSPETKEIEHLKQLVEQLKERLKDKEEMILMLKEKIN